MAIEDAVLDGHLCIAKELFSFVSPEMKHKLGSDEESGGNLIKVSVFPSN